MTGSVGIRAGRPKYGKKRYSRREGGEETGKEPQNPFGWKKPLRPSGPTVTLERLQVPVHSRAKGKQQLLSKTFMYSC